MTSVDWNALRTAHGTAAHVPDALRALRSTSDAVRVEAYWKIDNFVVLQSDLYEAALPVVPVLIDHVSVTSNCGRELAYDLLSEIGNGSAPPDVTVCSPTNDQRVPLAVACRRAVELGRSVYERDLADDDADVRQGAKSLIDLLDEQQVGSAPSTGG